jgi:hypothetical protein
VSGAGGAFASVPAGAGAVLPAGAALDAGTGRGPTPFGAPGFGAPGFVVALLGVGSAEGVCFVVSVLGVAPLLPGAFGTAVALVGGAADEAPGGLAVSSASDALANAVSTKANATP